MICTIFHRAGACRPTQLLLALSTVLALFALPAFGAASCPVDMPDEIQELHLWPHEFVIELGGSLDDFTPPVLRIDGQDAVDVLPPGTCSIRFRRIAGWHWGNPQPLGGLPNNADTDVLEDFDFVVWGLGLPGCNGPTTWVTPSTGGGHWPNGATQLVVQTDVAPCDNIELMNTDGLPYHDWPELTEPGPEPDPCVSFPVLCLGWDNPCIGHVVDPNLCGEAESMVDLGWKTVAPLESAVANLDLAVALLAADPGQSEIGGVLRLASMRAEAGQRRFEDLTSARDDLAGRLREHPELADQPISLRSQAAMATSMEVATGLVERCYSNVVELERGHATGVLTADAAADAQNLCRSAIHSLGRVAHSAERLWAFGLESGTAMR